jgi:hypothetical protein
MLIFPPSRVATLDESKHGTWYAAGGNLSRPEKVPQFRHIGEGRQDSADHFDRVGRGLLCPQP